MRGDLQQPRWTTVGNAWTAHLVAPPERVALARLLESDSGPGGVVGLICGLIRARSAASTSG